MLFSLDWLLRLCPADRAVDRVVAVLTDRGLTVDAVEPSFERIPSYLAAADDRTRRLLVLQNAAFLTLFRAAMVAGNPVVRAIAVWFLSASNMSTSSKVCR